MSLCVVLDKLCPYGEDAVFLQLDFRDHANLQKTCIFLRWFVKRYLRRTYRLERVLLPYFSHEDIFRFRALQCHIGFIISGSTALSFFTGEDIPGSDLDLYVDRDYAGILVHFLLECQCTFNSPPYHVESDRTDDPWWTLATGRSLFAALSANPRISYAGEFIDTVLNFTTPGRKKMQVVVARNSAIDVVLSFHS
ncbi:hypothetical protein MPER_07538, partial [Moniliophthora perniciosa FA553]